MGSPYLFRGKWALITGASSGIGKVFAHALAKRGADVVLVARSEDELKRIAAEISERYKVRAETIALDLSVREAPAAVFKRASGHGISPSILINNAGFGTYGKLQENSLEQNSKEVLLNVHALAQLTQLFLPAMQSAQDGAIINLASVAGFQPTPYMAVYGATKAFVLSFSEALWAENLHTGVRVLALCPGPVETQFFKVLGSNEVAKTGQMDTPANTVATALRALDQGRSYIVSGSIRNYLLTLGSRFAPRSLVAKIGEKMLRPK